MATVLLYAVDLDEMRRWVGCGDAALVREGLSILREDDEADWEPEELQLLERLLHRMVMEGRLYEELPEAERYYLTQLLIDLFDELVESEALSDELPLAALDAALTPVRARGGPEASAAGWLTRGRLLGSDETVWDGQADLDEILPYFGTVTWSELPALQTALEGAVPLPRGGSPAPPRRGARQGAGKGEDRLLTAVRSAAKSVLETERDLLAFVA
jgi:hypothetical protein